MPQTPNCPQALESSQHKIETAIEQLKHLNQEDIQARWRQYCGDRRESHSVIPAFNYQSWDNWPIVKLNARRHVAWSRGKQELCLAQTVTVPKALNHYALQGLTLRFGVTWWANFAEIFVDGRSVQPGDIFDCSTRIVLTQAAEPGQQFEIVLRLLSPGHDEGALVQSHLVYEVPNSPGGVCPEPSFVADELAVLQCYVNRFQPEHLETVAQAVDQIDWATLAEMQWDDLTRRDRFHQSLTQLRQDLQPLSPWLKQRQIHCQGHAHLDLAWLWPIDETWAAAERTFESVLGLQQDFPELTYTHSSPALFAWLAEHRPALFRTIQQQIQAGRWTIDAGLWVEPEFNIVGGESIARQVLYGQRFCQQQFGHISAIAWLPDSFGFCWQLPQILHQGGITCFATQKLRWNDTNPFPHNLFHWQAPDGTTLLGLTLPPIGSDIDPIKMADYASTWEAQTGLNQSYWLPGVGDHGGGPSRDMLEKARRWATSPFFPKLSFSTAVNFLTQALSPQPNEAVVEPAPPTQPVQIQQDIISPPTPPLPHSPALPIHPTDLYLELHRGCYTTHADQKQFNRRCEDLLTQAEIFAAIAQLTTPYRYPQAELETAWKGMLFNQFHDILPGTSIPEVFTTANQTWQQTQATGERVLQEAQAAIAAQIPLPDPPVPDAIPFVVFNGLSWARTELATIQIPDEIDPDMNWQVYTAAGETVSTQIQAKTDESNETLLFLAEAIPSVGYRLYWLAPSLPVRLSGSAELTVEASRRSHSPTPASPNTPVLENARLKVTINTTTGDLVSLYDKTVGREVLRAPGNQLQAFEDSGQYWDAWNIAPNYAKHPLPPTQLQSIAWVEYGPLRQRLRVARTLTLKTRGTSTFTQDYVLDAASPVLKIETTADWQAEQVVLKTAFPFTLHADQATYETAYGAIARTTQPQTPQEQAQWEVPAVRWADLSQRDCDVNYGVSLLSDYKHGYDAAPNQLRLTLLKAPLWPDPTCDRGVHRFTYGVYPHSGSWQQAHTVRQAHGLNVSLQSVFCPPAPHPNAPILDLSNPHSGGQVLWAQSFLSMGSPNVVLSTFKQSEDNPNQYILRGYEAHGDRGELNLETSLPIGQRQPVNLLETDLREIADNPLITGISPWQVRSYRLTLIAEAP
ncbi:MAG: alpha-mannosidase [Cyanobacteria bacterium J06639_16]